MPKLLGPMCLLALAPFVSAQETVVVRPKAIDTVLVNPGVGFMTFQRFNGDKLNEGLKWTEGYPIEYQEFKGKLDNDNHPATSIAYFRIYWKFIEPLQEQYRWDLFDTALKTAHSRGQTLMLRVAPYGTTADNDVPDWYRTMLGDEKGKLSLEKWRTDPEDPRYVRHFGGMIRALGARYDGNPDLESVDMALVGAWGEGPAPTCCPKKRARRWSIATSRPFRRPPWSCCSATRRPTSMESRGVTSAGAWIVSATWAASAIPTGRTCRIIIPKRL